MPPPLTPWPPLITGAHRPDWVRFRDTFLTLLAWFILAWLLRDLIHLVYDFLRPPRFELTIAAPDFGALWERLQYFVMMSTVLVVWLALRAASDRRRRLSAGRVPQPRSLTIGEEARWAGVDEKAVGDGRSRKVTN